MISYFTGQWSVTINITALTWVVPDSHRGTLIVAGGGHRVVAPHGADCRVGSEVFNDKPLGAITGWCSERPLVILGLWVWLRIQLQSNADTFPGRVCVAGEWGGLSKRIKIFIA